MRPTRRWRSWTDEQLVTAKGDEILRDLDTFAIPHLRRNHLVWSGWGESPILPTEQQVVVPDSPWAFRDVVFDDPRRMRLFGLSLLWRAAASRIFEMSDIQIPDDDLAQLTFMVREGNPEPLTFYPFTMYQISTRGPAHNFTPISSIMTMPALGLASDGEQHPIIRIYVEGLSLLFHRRGLANPAVDWQTELGLGGGGRFTVGSVTYEASFQAQNLQAVQAYTERNFSTEIDKLMWPRKS